MSSRALSTAPTTEDEPTAKSVPSRWPWDRLADAGLILAFLAVAFLMGCFPVQDIDFWWHLRTGDLIRETGVIPKGDIYTFSVPGKAWIDLHWGFQVLLSWSYQHLGIEGTNLAKNGVTCLALMLLLTAKKRDWPTWVMVLAWLPALVVLSGRMYVRPETLSLLWLSCFLAILVRWDERPKLAFLLPIVQVAWVNSQGLFVLGPVLLGAALLDAALRPGAFAAEKRPWWRTIGVASALMMAACLVNPYGIEGTLFPLALTRTMGSPIFRNTIAELIPIPMFIQRNGSLRNPMLLFHLGTIVLGAFSFLAPIAWRAGVRVVDPPKAKKPTKGRKKAKADPTAETWRLSPFRLLIFAAFTALSWQATRNSHQFAAVVGTVTAWNIGEWFAAMARRRRLKAKADPDREFAGNARPRAFAFVTCGALLVAVATGGYFQFMGERRVLALGFVPNWFPHKAIEFAGRPEMPERFLSLSFGWAAVYIYHHGPDRKVFIDPRLEVAGPELYERYIELERDIAENRGGWVQRLDELGRPVVFVGHAGLTDPAENAGIVAPLLANPRWRLVYFDSQASIFVHDSYREAVAAHPVDLAYRHFHPDTASEPHGSTELHAESRSLWRIGLGLEGLQRGDLAGPIFALGLDDARRMLRADPDSPEAWKMTALILGARDLPDRDPKTGQPLGRSSYRAPFSPLTDLATARASYAARRTIELVPDDVMVRMGLLDSVQLRGMSEEADALVEALLQRSPTNAMQANLQKNLARNRRKMAPVTIPTDLPNRNAVESQLQTWLDEGRVASAARLIEQEFPPSARDWTLADRLASLQLHIGRPEQARATWQAVAEPPDPGLRQARVAATYLIEGNVDAAQAAYQEAIRLDPNQFEAHYGLAVLESDLGHADAALAAAREAIRTAPTRAAKAAAQAISTAVAPYAGR